MPAARTAREKPRTILLIEDEPVVENVIRKLLEREGYNVLSAADGQDALKLFEQHSGVLALMLVDIALPDVSGAEFIERIPTLTPRIPVVFITGLGTLDRQVLELTRKNFPVLYKPFRPAELVRAVATAIARFRLDSLESDS